MSNQTIRVVIDPNDQPSSTAAQTSATPLNQQSKQSNGLMKVNPLVLGAAVSAGKQVFSAVTNNIGNYTGRTDIQRKVNNGLSNARIVGQLGAAAYAASFSNPFTAVALVSAIAVEGAVTSWEQNKNAEMRLMETEYYNQVRGNRINESRYR